MRIDRRFFLGILGLLSMGWLQSGTALAVDEPLRVDRAPIKEALQALYQESFEFTSKQGLDVNFDAIPDLTKSTVQAIEKMLEPKYVLYPSC